MNFWQTIKKPILGLAPMDGMTDAAFRYTLAATAKPDIIFAEFVNADGIIKGKERALRPLIYSEIERPIVAQLFGVDPEMFYQSAKVICELGFDGLDINMGCPAKTVTARGAGAGLIRNPGLAKEIFIAAQKGIQDWANSGLEGFSEKNINKINSFKSRLIELGVKFDSKRKAIPLSVKTRIGYDTNIVEDWISTLMEVHPANITVHGRLLKQMYAGKADWNAIKQAALVVRSLQTSSQPTTILGNGDVKDLYDIPKLITETGVDGILVGRATLGNPWFFEGSGRIKTDSENIFITSEQKTFKEVRDKLIEHAEAFERIFGMTGFVSLRKHMAWYIRGFENAVGLRVKLMQAENLEDVKKFLAIPLDKSSMN
jgi:tRNA-dihydrouridine synthase